MKTNPTGKFTLPEIISPDLRLIINQPLFSKARPRMTRFGHTYMPPAYKEQQSKMRDEIRKQWQGGLIEGPFFLCIKVFGEGRGDLDNIAGSFMDAAQGIIFPDDRVSVISKLFIEWEKASKADSKWIIDVVHL